MLSEMREREPYDGARDVAFFEPGSEFVTVRAGMFAIFGPEDVHSPCHAAGSPMMGPKSRGEGCGRQFRVAGPG